ncbi:alpha/beta-hydrolase [Lindgomyces ingoldianus]|uniref:Alpha/beta-hydrolase n=1 Tax=Lindgomyces ingoldianus TaxID=673940 RepID=A0ACB6QMU2_9PLEO|nr:alpha/beta-hydrolase [Lindgomyces ingoldianus]KAF2468294.1 alpha/beta-hydrolase [Lindgomyces ingoldianus]
MCTLGLASVSSILAASSCPGLTVSHDGEPVGEFKNVSGIQVYHSYAKGNPNNSNAILYVTDIYGVPLLQNKLLADSIARANYNVIMPDLFNGDAVPVTSSEGPALNLTDWRARHPTAEIDRIIGEIIAYMRNSLGVKRIGAVGYCFGGKYVPRFLSEGKGIDVGFIAHPSSLEAAEIQGIAGPISIAAGELDSAFNATGRRKAEDILTSKNSTYEANLYSGAPHGFGVRVDLNNKRQKYAKEASFFQAITWFNTWL